MGNHFEVEPSTLHRFASRTLGRHEQVSGIAKNVGSNTLPEGALGSLGGASAAAISGSLGRAGHSVNAAAENLSDAGSHMSDTARRYEEVDARNAETFRKIIVPDTDPSPVRGVTPGSGETTTPSGATIAAPPEVAGESIADNVDDPRQHATPLDQVPSCGDPIAVTTGWMMLAQNDVELPGRLPLVLSRAHLSSYRVGRMFGATWASTLDQRLEVGADGIWFATEDGMLLSYPTPTSDEPVLPLEGPRRPLTRDGEGFAVVDPDTDQARHFTANGTLSRIDNGDGDRIDFDHDRTGTVTALRHSVGWHIDVTTEDGLVTALHLRSGDGAIPLVRYGYDDRLLVEVINSSGQPLRLSYDHAGRITRWQDRNGTWYGYEYDGEGRCVRAEGAGGMLAYTFDYDRERLVTTVTDSLGHATVYQLNAAWQVIAQTDPLGNTARQEWDRYDRLLARTDPLGRTTRFGYDADGNLTAVTHPDGSRDLAEYNDHGRQIAVTDANGAVRRWEYTPTGRLACEIDPAGARTTYRYDPAGRLTGVVDPSGALTGLASSRSGLAAAITDPLGAVTRVQYDELGRVGTMTDELGGVTRLAWTVEGQPRSVTAPDGTVSQWRYDGEGNVREAVDQRGQVTSVDVDHLDLPVARTGPDGGRLALGYDTELRLTSLTNELGRTWRYEYDAAGNVVAETDFAGRVSRHGYDAAGQRVTSTNAAGQTVRMSYDARGLLVRKESGGDVTTFGYDAAGRMVSARNAAAEVTFAYDRMGRVVAETVNGRTVASAYDALGRRVLRRTPTGARSDWEYDGNHQPAALRTAGRVFGFGHDAAGREVRRQWGAAELAQEWDGSRRLVTQSLTIGADTVQRRDYTYRADGHLTDVLDRLSGPRRYALDAAGRVTGVRSRDRTERYAYDPAGNLVPSGRVRYREDAAGRVVLRERVLPDGTTTAWRYEWDADDRLIAVRTPDGQHWRYRYDPLGRRIAKARVAADGTELARTDFTWDGTELAEQVHDGRYATVWDWHPDGYRVLAQTERVADQRRWTDRQCYVVITDLIGTPAELVGSDGTVAWHGSTTLWGATGPAATPLRFPGQYFDQETGLHYNLHRYYDPATARYLSPDPLGLLPGPNPLAYVHNPTASFDPLGLAPCTYDELHANPQGSALRLRGPFKWSSPSTWRSPLGTSLRINDAERWNAITQNSGQSKFTVQQHPQQFNETQPDGVRLGMTGFLGDPNVVVARTNTLAMQTLGAADRKSRPYWDAQQRRDQSLAEDALALHNQAPARDQTLLDNTDHTLAGQTTKIGGATALLQNNNGLIIGGAHRGGGSPWDFLNEQGNMAALHNAGARRLYIEEARDDDHQALLDQYRDSPAGTAMDPALRASLNGKGGEDLVTAVENAKAAGIHVYAVGGNPARLPDDITGQNVYHARAVMFNTYASQVVLHHDPVTDPGAPPSQEKWIMTAGRAHTVTHTGAAGIQLAGQTLPTTFPGLGDILNVPVVGHGPNDQFVQIGPNDPPN